MRNVFQYTRELLRSTLYAHILHIMKHVIWFWMPPLGYMGAIFFVSNLSNPQIGGETPDYALHALEYFVLALLLIRLLLTLPFHQAPGTIQVSWYHVCLLGMALSIAYGIGDEIHQYFIPGRHCSAHDVFSDAAGSALAFGVAVLDIRYWSKSVHVRRHLKRFPRLHALSYSAYRNAIPLDNCSPGHIS